ncbi:response regulator [Rhizobacter sp. LjRoot28]|uniref:response regulator n=1 Tax=Rhizobacter sp. LjRoot28 TaxID=3342309 RepID=UPI003ECDA788
MIAESARRGLTFYFDYPGPPSRIACDAHAVQRSLHRLLSAATHLLEEGVVIFTAEAVPTSDPAHVELRLDAAVSGTQREEVLIRALLAQLDLHPPGEDGAVLDEVRAQGCCPVTGADVVYRGVPSAGAIFSMTLRCPGEVEPERLPEGHGSEALVLQDAEFPANGLARRLQRLGWDVHLFHEPEAVEAHLSQAHCPFTLVIVLETLDHTRTHRNLDAITTLAAARSEARFIRAVHAGSPLLEDASAGPWEVRVVPFLPSELWDLTLEASRDSGFEASPSSRPTPLDTSHRPFVLVVDDDEVNCVIAAGLLRMIGYDASAVASGPEAIEACRRRSPDLVLMDIHMPGMNGYEAAAELKRLQQLGAIRHFPIVAATAGETRQKSMDQGLEGHLTKPLMVSELKGQLNRVLKGLAVGL